MAPTLHQEIGLRQDTTSRQDLSREVSPPAVQPEGLLSPLSASLPRTAAGPNRLAARTARLHGLRLDWAELGMVGLVVSSAILSVYRLFWAMY